MSELKRQESLVDEATVLEYLARYPEFFQRHGAMLDRIRIPHAQKGTVSLVERQLDRQRERIEQLEQEITELMGVASENERIFRVYADLYGEIYGCQTLFELSAVMGKAFVQRLRLTGLRLWLSPKHFQLSGPEQRFLAEGRQLDQLLGQRLPGTDYYFGRLNQGEKQALFGNDVLVNSVALMRLGELGVLAFASSDPSHFTPHNDTLLLGQLGRLLQLRLPELARG
ncbi:MULTISPECIES: DUF484 family protein [Aeromonas]|uniref:DUF484 family protein n=1 Tax=Aeromonas TaxID=642 RepID=UPI0005A6F8AA|nr:MULTISPECIES: DUF484 family protein [Aeromonas]MEB6608263.1 DUF484 family protein [Aeromonas sanarellii]QXW30028.1 DUF484 family protein [Aeromonas sanarellii]WOX48049.1 DUF484 family protein [Aeromonas sp. XH]